MSYFLLPRIRKTLFIFVFVIYTPSVYSQISISVKRMPLGKFLDILGAKSGYTFFYKSNDLLNEEPVTMVDVQNKTIFQILDSCLNKRQLKYSIEKKTIVILKKESESNPYRIKFSGYIKDENDNPIIGASIILRSENYIRSVISDGKSAFSIDDIPPGSYFVSVAMLGYIKIEKQITLNNEDRLITINLKNQTSFLDEQVIIGYGATTRRNSIGNIAKINNNIFEQQPVANPLLALSGRASGVYVEQESGDGSNVKILIRGKSSIEAGNSPLYIIDGVPYPNTSMSKVFSAAPSSPFSLINPLDVQSIEILKDADATAIYGARGANGVVLISTKKAKPGKTQIDINMYAGVGKITRTPKMLNVKQYLELRRTAYKNDGVSPDEFTAPDLLVWDSTQNDFLKFFLGNVAQYRDGNMSITGGDIRNRFFLSGNYHHETGVYPNDPGYSRGSVHLNVEHSSDGKFFASASVNYSADDNNSISTDITSIVTRLPPNYPLYQTNGHINWDVDNPLSYLLQQYKGKTKSLIGSSVFRYKLLPELVLKITTGLGLKDFDEYTLKPRSSKNPTEAAQNDSEFNDSQFSNYIIEPQIDYNFNIDKSDFHILAGATRQENYTMGSFINANDFSTEALMKTPSAAKSIRVESTDIIYRYQSFWGRFNYSYNNKYLLSYTFRRDGSTRFGPNRRYGNFWSIGGAWIFSKEKVFISLPWINYGKLRGSLAKVGNDQIPDYGYYESYKPTNQIYNGILGIAPTRVANPNYSWETNMKIEAALEFALLNEKFFFSVSCYRNRSSNQLVNFPLSLQSGFSSYWANLPALIQNRGIEIELSSTNINNKDFVWTSSANLTIPKSKLVDFPGLSNSSYVNDYIVGESTSIIPAFHFIDYNSQNGQANFEDLSGDNVLKRGLMANGLGDMIGVNNGPTYYGGLTNRIRYKAWELDFLLQFTHRKDYGILLNTYYDPVGTMANQPLEVLNRKMWATATPGTPAYDSYSNLSVSDFVIENASYLRLKNVSISYKFNEYILKRLNLRELCLFFRGQNLLTFTKYDGFDPENSQYGGIRMPPLKVLVGGVRIAFNK